MEALQPFRLLFLEEPTQPDDIEGLARIRAAGPRMDLATGERLYSKWEYLPLLERRLIDVIQPDLCHAGGITEVEKIASSHRRSLPASDHRTIRKGHFPPRPPPTWRWRFQTFLILEYVRQKYTVTAPYARRGLCATVTSKYRTDPVWA